MMVSALAAQARADEPAGEPTDDPEVEQARAAFREGSTLAEEARWRDALARFEASEALRPHASTRYNIAICQRALGHYTRARRSFEGALARHRGGETLPDSTLHDIEAYQREIERVLATLEISLDPPTTAIAIDGRPLELIAEGAVPTLVAGTRPAGEPAPPPKARFRVVLDPGAHLIVLSRPGFSNALVRRDLGPGSHERLALALERLPAELKVAASESDAAVSVDGLDVGLAPVSLKRPAGSYRVLVRKPGFEPYETEVSLDPAQRVNLMARMKAEPFALHERWWFWSSVAATLATTVVVTYVVTRPEPERPPLDGGGLGWTIRVP